LGNRLNVLARQLDEASMVVEGATEFNGSADLGTVRYGYVMQQDCLVPCLSVRETLGYAADLRLPDVPSSQRGGVVDEVVRELGLKECAHTRVGWEGGKGCSGGEFFFVGFLCCVGRSGF
jgi:ABC-type multidrug transport system ATPase subunit